MAEEVYLKSGDWIMFAQGGPKVSFLTKIDETRPAPAPSRPAYEEKKRFEPDNIRDDQVHVPAAPVEKPPIISLSQECLSTT